MTQLTITHKLRNLNHDIEEYIFTINYSIRNSCDVFIQPRPGLIKIFAKKFKVLFLISYANFVWLFQNIQKNTFQSRPSLFEYPLLGACRRLGPHTHTIFMHKFHHVEADRRKK